MDKPKESERLEESQRDALPSAETKDRISGTNTMRFNIRHLIALVTGCAIALTPISCLMEDARRREVYRQRIQKLEADLMALNQDHYLHPFRFDSVYAHKRRAQRSLILDKISDEELHQLIQKNSIVFEQIKSLWIEYASDLSPASYEKIAAMPNLEHLMLSNAEALPLASLKPFGKAPAIRSIYAQHADFTGEDIRNLIPHLRDFSSRSYHFPYGIEYLEELKKIHGEEKDWSEGAHPEFREYEWYDPVTPRGRDIIYEPWRENAMFRILD